MVYDEDAGGRAGLMLHIEALMAVACSEITTPNRRGLRVFLGVGAML